MTTKCMWGGCGRDAKFQICIKLWALTMPTLLRTDKNCMRMISDVTICEECKPRVKAQDFLLPEGRERIATGIARAGKATPDFNAAQLDFEEIIDKPIDPEDIIRDAKRRGDRIWEA